MPKIVGGRRALSELRARRSHEAVTLRGDPDLEVTSATSAEEDTESAAEKRATNTNTSGQCGAGKPCATGYCCSAAG